MPYEDPAEGMTVVRQVDEDGNESVTYRWETDDDFGLGCMVAIGLSAAAWGIVLAAVLWWVVWS